MSDEIVNFYNKESSEYTNRRYPEVILGFSHYLFRKRRDSLLNLLGKIVDGLPQEASILDIGCADGVLFKAIEEKFPGRFSKLVGVDISPKMIEEAKKQNLNPKADFFLRDDFSRQKFDVVVELGVHSTNIEKEMKYVSDNLNKNGYFFYNTTGRKSVYVRLKLKSAYYVKDYTTYEESEFFIKKEYSIIESKIYGLFIPKLWAFSLVGRSFQGVFDALFRFLAPELFHEKLYLLKKN